MLTLKNSKLQSELCNYLFKQHGFQTLFGSPHVQQYT